LSVNPKTMPEIKVSCSQCGQHIQCDESYGGQQIVCPGCQQAFVVPQVLQAKPSLQITQQEENTYLVNSKGKQCGPYTVEELKSYLETRQLAWEDLAWCEGMSNWQPLRGIIVPTGLTRTPPPPPSPRRAGSQGITLTSWGSSAGKPPGKWWCFVLLLVFFFPVGIWYRHSRSWRELTTEQSVAVLAVGIGLVVVITVAVGYFCFR